MSSVAALLQPLNQQHDTSPALHNVAARYVVHSVHVVSDGGQLTIPEKT